MATGANSGTESAVCVASDVASKPIRVDNWGNFLAQRIEALYDKQEHCDLTLRFPHGDLKAHSLVLHACTPFFTNLLKGKTTGPKILKMPHQISSSAMGIILKFVYTGRLEAPFNVDMLYSTAKLLKLQVLIRLLEAQMNSADMSVSAGQPASPGRRGRPPYGYHRPRTTGSGYQPTNSQLAAKRTPVVGTGPVRAADPPEDARPSRFELPDSDHLELRLPVLESGLLRHKSESRVESPPNAGADREALFEHLRQTPVKRAAPSQENGAQKKRPKLEPTDTERDITVLREYYEEQRRRAQLLDEQGSGGAERVDDPAPEVDWQDQEADPPPKSTFRPEPSTPTTVTTCDQPPTTPRPILKQEPTPAGASSGKKRVQFSESPQLTLTVHDMGDTSELVSQLLKQHPEVLRGGQNVKIRLVAQTGTGAPSHTEFVVMKQQSQQQQQQSVAAAAVTRRSATGGNTSETLDTPLSCSLCAQKGKQADFWWADQMAKHFQDEHGDASAIDLNTLSCTACVRAGDPIDFVTVDDYFTHLRDVHDTRGVNSTGACQLCGFSADKKLQLIYHQYIKHKIRPPRFITFPKCDRCDFEAISDSEMVQHRQRRHKMGKKYKCKDCGSIFLNLSLLEGHMRTNACRQGSDEKRKFEWKCEFCGMSFSRSYNLKGHMRSVHKMSVERRRVSQHPSQPVAAVKQEVTTTVPALSVALDPSSEAENLSTVANSVAASLSLAVDGEYMALPDGIVPVEDENGVISYIALRPTGGDGGGAAAVTASAAATEAGTAASHSDDTVLEVTRYTMPVVVSSGAGSVTIQVAPAACGGGPGSSDGETVLPDLAIPSRDNRTIDLPQTARPDIARTLIPVPQLQTAGQLESRSGTPRGERRGTAAAGSGSDSSRISVSSSEVTVSDLAEPGSILPHLPGEPIPAAASPQPYGQAISLAQLQHGQIVMADGMAAGHVIVSELPSGQEVVVANMAPGRLYELQQSTGHDQLDEAGPQQPTENLPGRQKACLSQPREPGLPQAQHTGESVPSQNRAASPPETQGGAIAVASQQGVDMTQDTHHTHEGLMTDISHSSEFIGPGRLPGDPDIADVQPDRETGNLVTVKHDANESGPPATDEVDTSVQPHDQHSGASEGDIDAHKLQSVVAHYQQAGLSGHQAEQTLSERNEGVSKCSSGGVTVAPESQLGQVEGESVARQPPGDGATVAGEILGTVPGNVEVRSPEGRTDLVGPEKSPAVAGGDESQLVLVLDEEKGQTGAVEVQDVAAVEREEVVTEQRWSDSPVRTDNHSRLSVMAADSDGTWEALPSADDSTLRRQV